MRAPEDEIDSETWENEGGTPPTNVDTWEIAWEIGPS
jgi:hypothetical protein